MQTERSYMTISGHAVTLRRNIEKDPYHPYADLLPLLK